MEKLKLLKPLSPSAVTHWDRYYVYAVERGQVIQGDSDEYRAKRSIRIFEEHEQRRGGPDTFAYIPITEVELV